jgi:CRISPR-associated protein Csm4
MTNHKTYIFSLHPVGGYRTELRSDTLWGLVCWGIRLLYGESELERFLSTYADAPELILSSAFPFKMDGREQLRFYPVPHIPAHYPAGTSDYLENYRLRKDVKKIRWVNETDFIKLLKGEFTEKDLWDRASIARKMEAPDAKIADFGAKSQEQVQQKAPKINTQTFTHNTIHRINLSTFKSGNKPGQLFHSDEMFIVDEANETNEKQTTGLFFLASGTDEMIKKVAAVLRFYRFNGLGGDRSTGKGTFNITQELFNGFPEPADANTQTTLSLYHPLEQELTAFKSSKDNGYMSYLTEQREGRIGFWTSNARKTSMLYFREGSVFPNVPGVVHFGTSPSKTTKDTSYPYYAYGHAFMVKMKIN